MNQLNVKCQCGTVQGTVDNALPSLGNHLKCYCSDCQAFANHLALEGGILDTIGGTEVFQTAPWNLSISQGMDQLQCLRLTPKGLNRWYTKCCNTPVGNTIKADIPFLGLIHSFIVKDEHYNQLGPVIGHYKLEQATGNANQDVQNMGMPLLSTLKVFGRLIKWKFTMKGKKNLFFNEEGRTVSKPIILSKQPDV